MNPCVKLSVKINTKSLETINLGHNNITNEGIHRLKDGLLQNKSLLRIGLQAAKISCEGMAVIISFYFLSGSVNNYQ